MNLQEVRQSEHYLERKQDRGNILALAFSPRAIEPFTQEQAFPKLKQEIQSRLNRVLKAFEAPSTRQTGGIIKVYPVLTPVLENNGKTYPVTITAKVRDDDKDNVGTTYVIVQAGDTLVTLMIVPPGADLAQQTKEHLEKKVRQEKISPNVLTHTIQVGKVANSEFVINVKDLLQGKEVQLTSAEITQEELPYKVRTDYRKGASFTHDTYGIGKVESTSAGTGGDPGISGKLDWIDVDFGKPFLKGGKLTTIRRIGPVYATRHFTNK